MPVANWKRTIKGVGPAFNKFHDGEFTFEQLRDALVDVFKKDVDFLNETEPEYGGQSLFDLVECDLANAESEKELEWALDEIYDWADDNNVWIDPLD